MPDTNVVPSSQEGNPFPEIRGRAIRVDHAGRVSLNDIWQAAGAPGSQRPSDWAVLPTTTESVRVLIAEKSGNKTKSDANSVLYARVGRGGGTWAHPNLAIQYAGYLSPELRVEIHAVFLRYKLADPTLTADLIDRTSGQNLDWLDKRLQSKRVRNRFTGCVAAHGVREHRDFARVTNGGYRGLHGLTAAEMKQARGLSKNASLRDHFTLDELVHQMMLETAATNRIERTDVQGVDGCERATYRSGRNLRDFLDQEDREIEASIEDRRRG